MASHLGVTERALYKRFKLLGIRPSALRKGYMKAERPLGQRAILIPDDPTVES